MYVICDSHITGESIQNTGSQNKVKRQTRAIKAVVMNRQKRQIKQSQ